MTDPRVLIPMLESLQQGLDRGVMECRDSISDGERVHRLVAEHGARLAARLRALEALTEEDERRARQTLAAVESAEVRVEGAAARSSQVLHHARHVRATADRTRDHWRAEVARATQRLAAAVAWVGRAEDAVAAATARVNAAAAAVAHARNRVAAAEHAVVQAQHQLMSAQNSLAAAQAALAACLQPRVMTDAEGRQHIVHNDCSGCYAMVASAEASLMRARHALAACQQELAAAHRELSWAEHELAAAEAELAAARLDLATARAERAAAEQDLRECKAALAKAERAVELASASVVRAEAASEAAAASAEAAIVARAAAERAEGLSVAQRQRCELLDALLIQADESLRQGDGQVRQARRHGDAAADGARACNYDLSLRVDQLRELNRPRDFA